jgi:hypothetical protein
VPGTQRSIGRVRQPRPPVDLSGEAPPLLRRCFQPVELAEPREWKVRPPSTLVPRHSEFDRLSMTRLQRR